MAGFGQTANAQKELKKEEKVQPPMAVTTMTGGDMFADMRAEEAKMTEQDIQHLFVGIAGFDGTCKSGIVTHAFGEYLKKHPDAIMPAIDFDMGVAMLNSAVNNNPNIKSWKPWQMGTTDRTAYDYPGTHDRVMKIMRYILHQVESGEEHVWGVLVSGLDSWLEICTNNMRIIDLGLAKDGIESADIRGAGEAKRVERQSDWAIRNTRFHQLTALSRSLVRAGVRVFWETHLRATNFSYGKESDKTMLAPEWEKKTNNYLPTIIWMEQEEHYDDENQLVKTEYKAVFKKCKTNPELQDQTRTVFVTRPDSEPEWFGLPELYDGSL
tara:strand:+ start:681 stop:1655 length:975 start_codon:yes stop_codon:yes gene_type:complete